MAPANQSSAERPSRVQPSLVQPSPAHSGGDGPAPRQLVGQFTHLLPQT